MMEGDLTKGGEPTIYCTDSILWNRAPDTGIILLTSVSPINSTKRRNEKEKEYIFPSN